MGGVWSEVWVLLREEEPSCLCPGSLASQRPLAYRESECRVLQPCKVFANSAFVQLLLPLVCFCLQITTKRW